jgi:hypothetical protein
MTIEIAEFKCPACGHLMGEDEYRHACNEFNKKVRATCDEEIEKLKVVHSEDLCAQDEKYRRKMQEQEELHRLELDDKIRHEVQIQLTEYEVKSKNEKATIIEKYEQKLRKR